MLNSLQSLAPDEFLSLAIRQSVWIFCKRFLDWTSGRPLLGTWKLIGREYSRDDLVDIGELERFAPNSAVASSGQARVAVEGQSESGRNRSDAVWPEKFAGTSLGALELTASRARATMPREMHCECAPLSTCAKRALREPTACTVPRHTTLSPTMAGPGIFRRSNQRWMLATGPHYPRIALSSPKTTGGDPHSIEHPSNHLTNRDQNP